MQLRHGVYPSQMPVRDTIRLPKCRFTILTPHLIVTSLTRLPDRCILRVRLSPPPFPTVQSVSILTENTKPRPRPPPYPHYRLLFHRLSRHVRRWSWRRKPFMQQWTLATSQYLKMPTITYPVTREFPWPRFSLWVILGSILSIALLVPLNGTLALQHQMLDRLIFSV